MLQTSEVGSRVAAARRQSPIPTVPSDTGVGELPWRFLLPLPAGGSFEHLVLLGGSDPMAHRIIASGVARRVSRQVPTDASADAVIRLADAAVDLVTAGRCLRPGGVLYAELRTAPGTGGLAPVRIRGALRRAGLSPTALYWCRPDTGRPSTYVPLDTPRALRWYCKNLFRGASAGGALLGLVVRALSRLGEGAASSVLRNFAVTAVAGARHQAKPFVLGSSRLPNGLHEADLRVLLLASRNERTILLPFTRTGDHPAVAIKVANAPRYNAHTENEHTVLAEVREQVDESLRQTIPQPLGCFYWNGLAVGIDEGVQGRLLFAPRLNDRLACGRSIDELRRVTGWLVQLHRQTGAERVRWAELEQHQQLAARFEAFAAAFGEGVGDSALFGSLLRLSDELADARIALVWSQGDFHGGNIYRQGERLRVIDWAAAGRTLPLLDLLKFAEQWNNHVRRTWDEAGRARSFREMFVFPNTAERRTGAVWQAVLDYTDRLQLDRRFVPMLLVIGVVDLALYHHSAASSGNAAVHRRYASVYVRYVQSLAARGSELLPVYDSILGCNAPAGV
jgi:hypothetical protein